MEYHVTKLQHTSTKVQTVILIFQDIALNFWYVVLFSWIYDDTVKNELEIGKYLETTRGSELHKWHDGIIPKEK